jgi:hypothetical protein
VAAWWATYRGADVSVGHLFDLVKSKDLLPDVLEGRSRRGKPEDEDHARRVRLGRALGRKREFVYGGLQIDQAEGEDKSGRKVYRLKPVDQGEAGEREPGVDPDEAGEDPQPDDSDWSGEEPF